MFAELHCTAHGAYLYVRGLMVPYMSARLNNKSHTFAHRPRSPRYVTCYWRKTSLQCSGTKANRFCSAIRFPVMFHTDLAVYGGVCYPRGVFRITPTDHINTCAITYVCYIYTSFSNNKPHPTKKNEKNKNHINCIFFSFPFAASSKRLRPTPPAPY